MGLAGLGHVQHYNIIKKSEFEIFYEPHPYPVMTESNIYF